MTDLKDQYEQFFPFQMMEIELTRPIPALKFDAHYQRAWVLGRLRYRADWQFHSGIGYKKPQPSPVWRASLDETA